MTTKKVVLVLVLISIVFLLYNSLYKDKPITESAMDSQVTDNDKSKTSDQSSKQYTKPSQEELRKILTSIQYNVTQEDGTETPFDNEYWNNKAEGIYVDIVSGEPLFSSTHKYNSGTGWPSFYKPLVDQNIIEKIDKSLFLVRTEVRSKHGDSHLGHVFDDGPDPTGLRYCINSAALRFIGKESLEEEGYEEFLYLFED